MAEDKKNNVNVAGEGEQAKTDAKKAAEKKVAKAAKGNKEKKDKPSVASKIKKFFKDFKGESKKIVWPDGRTVLKSTLIVIIVVAVVALVVFGIDSLLAFIIKSLEDVAAGSGDVATATDAVKNEAAMIVGLIGNLIG